MRNSAINRAFEERRGHLKHVADRASQPQTIAQLARENTNLRRELEVFRALAYRDPLTGLWNRRYCEERLSEEVARARRAPRRPLTVAALDVDNLKRVNDAYGHAAGDRLLAWVGRFLRKTVRAHDICCRTGGDEFTLILPDLGRQASAALISRLRTSLGEANLAHRPRIGLSIGVAAFPDDAATSEALLACADTAMYEDKRTRKSLIVQTPTPLPVVAPTFDV